MWVLFLSIWQMFSQLYDLFHHFTIGFKPLSNLFQHFTSGFKQSILSCYIVFSNWLSNLFQLLPLVSSKCPIYFSMFLVFQQLLNIATLFGWFCDRYFLMVLFFLWLILPGNGRRHPGWPIYEEEHTHLLIRGPKIYVLYTYRGNIEKKKCCNLCYSEEAGFMQNTGAKWIIKNHQRSPKRINRKPLKITKR